MLHDLIYISANNNQNHSPEYVTQRQPLLIQLRKDAYNGLVEIVGEIRKRKTNANACALKTALVPQFLVLNVVI